MDKPKNLILIIFGASGDLTSRKLMPALYSLSTQGLFPNKISIIGTGRTSYTDSDFRNRMRDSILTYSEEKVSGTDIDTFTANLKYLTMDNRNQDDFRRLKELVEETDAADIKSGNFIFYMATPPVMYESIALNLSAAGLLKSKAGFRRIIIEKPFGYDLESGRKLNKVLHNIIEEEQIFRIDHYLGKETVQNLLVTRFANGLFEPLWNRNYIDRIEITSSENIGVEERGGYYDSSGALRDMVQNHLLQMVGLTAMEPPSSLDSNAIRNEVLKVFQSLQPIKQEDVPKQVIRGQYTPSIIRGECVK